MQICDNTCVECSRKNELKSYGETPMRKLRGKLASFRRKKKGNSLSMLYYIMGVAPVYK